MREPLEPNKRISLGRACREIFGGRITPSALKTEARRGRLVIQRIQGFNYVTPAAIAEMRAKCRIFPPDRPAKPPRSAP